jgi:hypothetical protein
MPGFDHHILGSGTLELIGHADPKTGRIALAYRRDRNRRRYARL